METVEAARCVPIRELSRGTSELIDQVERDGKTFAVSRHGRLVALVVPLPERLQLFFEGAPPPSEPIEVEDPADEVELTDAQRALLIDIATNLTPTGLWKTREIPGELARDLFRLEIQGLIEFMDPATRRVTPQGRRIVAALRR